MKYNDFSTNDLIDMSDGLTVELKRLVANVEKVRKDRNELDEEIRRRLRELEESPTESPVCSEQS